MSCGGFIYASACSDDSNCSDGVCAPASFGDSPDACTEQYWSFAHVYQCYGAGSLGWQDDCPLESVEGGCCVFVPKVQVKDNWGWCTGSCAGRADGCYDASGNIPEGPNECDVDYPNDMRPDLNPWIYFDGQVIVTP